MLIFLLLFVLENLRGFKNGTFQGENYFSKYSRVDDIGKKLVKKLRKKLEIDIYFQNLEKPDEMQVQINSNSNYSASRKQLQRSEEIVMDGMPNFEPSVLRETQSSLNGINFDVDYLRCKKICSKVTSFIIYYIYVFYTYMYIYYI